MASKLPSMKRTRALTLSWRLTAGLKGRSRTAGWKRARQTRSLRAASLTQSTRDCWPAPTPTIWPSTAYATELDCVYLHVTEASTRSRRLSAGISVRAVTTFARSAAAKRRSFRFCARPTPNTSRYSKFSAGSYAASVCSSKYLPPFLAAKTRRASSSKPGATTPSETSRFSTSAVARSTVSDSATMSPKDDIGSACRARTYAAASGDSADSSSGRS
mmetsp:Transcript_1090/g.3117  ORF Transcript_1090/g.3117 Transcript_1090/m.3117 type:complete len:217 (-) Transcript_1090:1028-1678(-)